MSKYNNTENQLGGVQVTMLSGGAFLREAPTMLDEGGFHRGAVGLPRDRHICCTHSSELDRHQASTNRTQCALLRRRPTAPRRF